MVKLRLGERGMTRTDCPVDKPPIPMYLMCSYAYYMVDESLIPDHQFDALAKWILDNYDSIEHPHKELVTKDDLKAGTYLGKYPDIVVVATLMYRDKILGNKPIEGNENE